MTITNQETYLATLEASMMPVPGTECSVSCIRSLKEGGRYVTSPRLLWEITNNERLTGKHLKYICDTPHCMNTTHMIVRGKDYK